MTEFSQTNWSKAGFAQGYIDHADIYVIERRRLLNILKSFYVHFLRNKRKQSVLELGCGDGIIMHELLKLDSSISATLLDGSADMLKDQINAIEEIGFKDVDCFYKYGVFAMYGGRK